MDDTDAGLLRVLAGSPAFLPLCAAFVAVLAVRVVLAPLPAGPAGVDPTAAMAPSSLAMLMLFGATGLVWAFSEAASQVSRWAAGGAMPYKAVGGTSDEEKAAPDNNAAVERLELKLLRQAVRLGGVLGLCYACEHMPVFPHGTKYYSRDVYFFICLLMLLFCFYSLKKSRNDDLLGREQSEEWKGWMQFMFLLYHYYSASEVYNAIRVMITCYVWMTGFGNLSFFAKSPEGMGAHRIIQMMWRLNAAVCFLTLTMDNTYILYYICPLHTFYFFLTYVIMSVKPSWNQTTQLLQAKLLIAGVVIFLIWDAPFGLFSIVFGFLSKTPTTGAGGGVLYEWYFRSGLDHYSALMGMGFAATMPAARTWLKTVETLPPLRQWLVKGSVVAGGFVLYMWWYRQIFSLEKIEYNSWHPYTGVIPLVLYAFVRNISTTLRSYHLEVLTKMGATTLETYLLQHHLWLSSNAKSLLTVLPGYPFLNFVLTTALFYTAAQVLFHATTELKDILLPKDLRVCACNILFMVATLAMVLLHAHWIITWNFGITVVLVSMGAAAGGASLALLLAGCSGGSGRSGGASRLAALPALMLALSVAASAVLLVKTELASFGWAGPPPGEPALVWKGQGGCQLPEPAPMMPRGGRLGFTSKTLCCDWASHGEWLQADGCGGTMRGLEILDCGQKWGWRNPPAQCGFGNEKDLKSAICDRDIVFAGDSTIRNLFFATANLMGEHVDSKARPELKHSDQRVALKSCEGSLDFLWRPYVSDLEAVARNASAQDKVLVLGGGLWDALHVQDLSNYKQGIDALGRVLASRPSRALWVVTSAVHDEALTTEKKREHMTEGKVAEYRAAAAALRSSVAGTIDAFKVTSPVASRSADGVHYPEEVERVLASVFLRTLRASQPAPAPKVKEGRPAEGMSYMGRGVLVLAALAAMLLQGDGYLFAGLLLRLLAPHATPQPPAKAEARATGVAPQVVGNEAFAEGGAKGTELRSAA